MPHQRKQDIETRRELAQRKLTARLEALEAQGLEERVIQGESHRKAKREKKQGLQEQGGGKA